MSTISPEAAESRAPRSIYLYKGARDVATLAVSAKQDPIGIVRKDVADAMNSKHLAFLFGSGCSSARDSAGNELGIPTMAPMARDFLTDKVPGHAIDDDTRAQLRDALGIDVADKRYTSNLEALMEVLYGFDFALGRSDKTKLVTARAAVESAITAVKKYEPPRVPWRLSIHGG